MLLAPERSRELSFWDELYDAKDRNKTITATVAAVVQYKDRTAWEVEFEGIPNVRGYVTDEETGLPNPRMMKYFITKPVKVRVKGIDRKNGVVTCTRREITEENLDKIMRVAQEGQEVEALVSYVSDVWLGLDIGGGVIVNLGRREAGVSRSLPLEALYQEGAIVTARVEKVDESAREIKLSLIDPWQRFHYVRGDVVTGTVVRLGEKNLFVAVRPGMVGIAPYPAGGKKPVPGERDVYQVSEYNPAEKSLSLKQFDRDLVRGRKKNRDFWKRYRTSREQADQAEEKQ